MFDYKTIATAALTAVVVVVLAGLVGGNQSDPLGATGTRFPYGLSTNSTSPSSGQLITTTLSIGTTTNSGLSAGAAGATSTVNLGKVCYRYELSSGGGSVYYWFGPNGNIASSTASCN